MTIADKVKEIIVQELDVDEANVTPEAKFQEDLGADSLDTVELVMKFEENFEVDGDSVEIPDEEAEKIITVGDAVTYLENLGATVKD